MTKIRCLWGLLPIDNLRKFGHISTQFSFRCLKRLHSYPGGSSLKPPVCLVVWGLRGCGGVLKPSVNLQPGWKFETTRDNLNKILKIYKELSLPYSELEKIINVLTEKIGAEI